MKSSFKIFKAMVWVPLDFSRITPIIVPKIISNPILSNVLPKPFPRIGPIWFIGIPINIAKKILADNKTKKGWILK